MEIRQIDNLSVQRIYTDLYNDSIYYSNTFQSIISNTNNIDQFIISENNDNPNIKIKLTNDFGQEIVDLGSEFLVDNETFLSQFKGFVAISVWLKWNAILKSKWI